MIYTNKQYFTFCEKLIEFQNFFEFSEGKIYDKNTGTAISNEIADLVINSENPINLTEFYQITMASPKHLLVIYNLMTFLASLLKLKGFRIHSENCHIFIKKDNKYRVPDAVIVNKNEQKLNENSQLENPFGIVEVLSASTKNVDLIAKVEEYQSIESLQEYVIIWQDQPKILQYSRLNNHWIKTEYEGLNDILTFDSLEISLSLKVLYEDVAFE
ncbi:MAG: Uma2 family endonuclease [Bacteroidetes bacterium]|nr:MAG: Uma2 family endonuclease [Bacteroidota bacterium]